MQVEARMQGCLARSDGERPRGEGCCRAVRSAIVRARRPRETPERCAALAPCELAQGRVGETMSYVHKVLLPGERVIYETGLHWLIYGRAILVLAIALLLAIGSTYAPSDTANVVLIVAGAAAL